MSRLIDFSNYKYSKDAPAKSPITSITQYGSQVMDIPDDRYKLTLSLLVHENPNKILFTIGEVALYINKGPEFIRRRIKTNRIQTTQFGDGPMIHIAELARLLTQGIK